MNTSKRLADIPYLGYLFLGAFKTVAFVRSVIPVSHNKRLFVQAGSVSLVFLTLTSFTPGGTFISTAKGYSADYINSYAIDGNILVTDEEGYLVKINPQTNSSNRIGLTDFAVHTVESGETLSVIAATYGVSLNTIKWENNLNNANSIRAGQKLFIPPVNGISHKVAKGDTIASLAKKYKISSESIIAQNNFSAEASLIAGNQVFLPNAEPIVVAPPVSVPSSRNLSYSRDDRAVDYSSISANSSAPAIGKSFIFPTRGNITQGYFAGHYAIDISDRSRPPVWAAYGGNVSKATVGTWGGGYGNHVIIDHGNGLKSLYAHLDSVNVVSGQWVNQGDVIGVMGNTGRVYGVTGIHLHWEVIDNGVKKNPKLYY